MDFPFLRGEAAEACAVADNRVGRPPLWRHLLPIGPLAPGLSFIGLPWKVGRGHGAVRAGGCVCWLRIAARRLSRRSAALAPPAAQVVPFPLMELQSRLVARWAGQRGGGVWLAYQREGGGAAAQYGARRPPCSGA
jgi:hypothetical protein